MRIGREQAGYFRERELGSKKICSNELRSFRRSYYALLVLLVTVLGVTSQVNFLLFHFLVEFFSVVVGVICFLVTWRAFRFTRQNFFMFLGVGYSGISALDAVHMLSYKGMGVFPYNDPNLPTQFWIAARFLEALVLVVAPTFLRINIPSRFATLSIGAYCAAMATFIFSGSFPAAFVEGQGLTTFKVVSEYGIIALLVVAGVRLAREKSLLTPVVYRSILASIVLTICGEFAFTLYVDVYGLSNAVGHIFKLVSFWLILDALFNCSFEQPINSLEEILWGTSAGTWEWNIQTGAVRFNDRWAEIVGYNLQELEPITIDTWTRLCHPDDLEVSNELLQKNFSGEADFYECEVRMLHKHGHWVWVLDRGKVVEWAPGGVPLRMSGTHTDISEKRMAEQEVLMAKEAAEAASRSKSEFLASMSHELRTPLNAILGYAQILQYLPDAALSKKQSEYVENIIHGGEHLLALVNDILDLARVESDRLSVFLESVSFEETLIETLSHLDALRQEKDIQIVVDDLGAPKPILKTDRMRLKQIIMNLMSNALKFSHPGGSVWIRSSITDRFLRVAVVDEGIGIPKSRHKDLFQIFNRAYRDPMKATSGAGVGLAVTKMLVERLGGQIGFESEENAGSTFWFELPLENNENVLIWTDDYRVGVDAIDKDHQVIFRLTNKVVQKNLDENEIAGVIRELIDYTSYHFRREEAIMEACQYPDLPQHKARHHKLEARVIELSEEWGQARDPEALGRLRSFLRNWWSGHIMDVDKTILEWAQGNEVEIAKKLTKIPTR